MKTLIYITVFTASLAACTSEPAPKSSLPEETGAPATKDTAADAAPLEDIIAKGDYNNDGPANLPVPGAASDRDIPEDPFLERVNSRTPE